MEVSKDIVFNILTDMRKREINPVQRAEFIKAVLDDRKISQRALAKELDMSHSTFQDWLVWGRLTEGELKNLLNEGVNKTDIYRSLRENRKEDKKMYTDFDILLDKVINRMRKEFVVNDKTIERATRLKLLLDNVLLKK